MNHYEIVKKLIGNIAPIGETSADNKRFLNLSDHLILTSDLIEDIIMVSENINRQEHSMNKAGKEAYNYLKNLNNNLTELLETK